MNKLISMTALTLIAGGAAAADNGIYLGASIGRANVDVEAIESSGLPAFDGNDMGYKIIAGVRPLDWLGAEISYVDFGTPDDESLNIATDSKGVSAFAVGFAGLGPVDVFAKAGLINWDAKLTSSGVRVGPDRDGTDFAYGAGVQVRLLSLGIRAEYERFEIEDGANMVSLGATWTFL